MRTTDNERSVRSILDDDEALDIVDSLEDDEDDDGDDGDDGDDLSDLFEDEPYEPPRTSRRHEEPPRYTQGGRVDQARTQQPAQNPSSSAKSAPEQGGSRIQFYRSLQGFLQAMSEAAPIYLGEKQRHPDTSEDDIRHAVGLLCARHLNLVERCLEINNANTQDIMLRYQRRTLAKNMAELYENHSMEELEGLVEIARSWSLQSKDFENSGSDNNTSDGRLGVKMSLFTATLKYHEELDGMWCGHSQGEVMLELQRIAIHLAKEVAFSWSKRAQVSDREGLFASALPHCLKIAQMAYNEVALSQLGGENYNALTDTPDLPLFDACAEENHVGYEDELMVELKSRVHQMAARYLNKARTPRLRHDDLLIWRNALLEEVDKALAASWEEAATDLMEEIDEMTDEEQETYLAEHDVMEFSRFEARAVERLAMLDRPGRLIRVDFMDVMGKAKTHLAWMWGVSDSLIAARKENLPGD